MAGEHKCVTVNATDCGFEETKYYHFNALVSRQNAALSSATQHNTQCQNSAENVERSILTLGPHCLSGCMRDTVWSSFILFWFLYHLIFSFSFGAKRSVLFSPNSRGMAFWVAEFTAALWSLPEWGNEHIKYFITSSRNRIHLILTTQTENKRQKKKPKTRKILKKNRPIIIITWLMKRFKWLQYHFPL